MDKFATLVVVGMALFSPWATPHIMALQGAGFTPDRPASLFECQVPLIKLLASSNQALIQAQKVPADKLEINIEPRDTPGAGHLGWVMYDPQSGQLLDNSADEQHPLPLTFNPQYGKQYQQCLQKEQRCVAIDEICQDEGGKFIVSGDSVTANPGQAYHEFLFVSYIQPKSGHKTEGWVKAEGLTVR